MLPAQHAFPSVGIGGHQRVDPAATSEQWGDHEKNWPFGWKQASSRTSD
jgi:hypothetical protein